MQEANEYVGPQSDEEIHAALMHSTINLFKHDNPIRFLQRQYRQSMESVLLNSFVDFGHQQMVQTLFEKTEIEVENDKILHWRRAFVPFIAAFLRNGQFEEAQDILKKHYQAKQSALMGPDLALIVPICVEQKAYDLLPLIYQYRGPEGPLKLEFKGVFFNAIADLVANEQTAIAQTLVQQCLPEVWRPLVELAIAFKKDSTQVNNANFQAAWEKCHEERHGMREELYEFVQQHIDFTALSPNLVLHVAKKMYGSLPSVSDSGRTIDEHLATWAADQIHSRPHTEVARQMESIRDHLGKKAYQQAFDHYRKTGDDDQFEIALSDYADYLKNREHEIHDPESFWYHYYPIKVELAVETERLIKLFSDGKKSEAQAIYKILEAKIQNMPKLPSLHDDFEWESFHGALSRVQFPMEKRLEAVGFALPAEKKPPLRGIDWQLARGRVDQAIEKFTQRQLNYFGDENGKTALALIKLKPEAFPQIWEAIRSQQNDRPSVNDTLPLLKFVIQGQKLTSMPNSAWDDFLKILTNRLIEQYENVDRRFVDAAFGFLKDEKAHAEAWQFLQAMEQRLSPDALDIAFGKILSGLDVDRESRFFLAYEQIEPSAEQTNDLDYWNARINIESLTKSAANSQQRLVDVLLSDIEALRARIRAWSELVMSRNCSSKKEIKREAKQLLNRLDALPPEFEKAVSATKRRVLLTMIKTRTKGTKEEFLRQDLPKPFQPLFLKKMAENGIIDQETDRLLSADDLGHVLELLASKPKAVFNKVIRGIRAYDRHAIMGEKGSRKHWKDTYEINRFRSKSDWPKVKVALAFIEREFPSLLKKPQESFRDDSKFPEYFTFILGFLKFSPISEEATLAVIKQITAQFDQRLIPLFLEADGFFNLIANKWDGTYEGFIKTFISKECFSFAHKRQSIYRINQLCRSDKELQKFISEFLCPTAAENHDLLNKVFDNLDLAIVPESIRQQNIEKTNQAQKDLLETGNFDIDFTKFDQTKRTLVIYCRHNQLGEIDFAVIANTLKHYVEGGFSSLFNRITIVSRAPGKYYEHFAQGIKYEDVSGEAFKRTCAVFANTLHPTHGAAPENQYGSIPMLGIPTMSDSGKMRGVQVFEPFNLKLDPRNLHQDISDQIVDSKQLIPFIQECIRAVQGVEQKTLELDPATLKEKVS